ncbi:hypothetical protein K438DRAFT_1864084, partial [Mycena galopus ATCC 62051]
MTRRMLALSCSLLTPLFIDSLSAVGPCCVLYNPGRATPPPIGPPTTRYLRDQWPLAPSTDIAASRNRAAAFLVRRRISTRSWRRHAPPCFLRTHSGLLTTLWDANRTAASFST